MVVFAFTQRYCSTQRSNSSRFVSCDADQSIGAARNVAAGQPAAYTSVQHSTNLVTELLAAGYLRETPPQGEAWTGHSLRKGAASGAGAIDVALFRICYVGGWSVRGGAVQDYIDASCPDTPAARRFFGWLLRS